MSNNDGPTAGGMAIMKIDGSKVREFRESKGLTQLYVATVVGVTTDTISRWENRRYPTIKQENALKLAEALEVALPDILEKQEPLPEEETEETTRQNSSGMSQTTRGKLTGYILGALMIATLVLISFSWWKTAELSETEIKVHRILPAHAPPGQPFPVIILLQTGQDRQFSVIVKDILPQSCIPLGSAPSFTTIDKPTGVLKWISKIAGGGKTVFSYMAKTSEEIKEGEQLRFEGTITLRKGGTPEISIQGNNLLEITGFHWADANSDNRIDDEEILTVYDTFGAVDGLEFDRAKIEDIWSGKGYHWDRKSRQYKVIP